MTDTDRPGPEFDEEDEGKVLDDLDPDEAEADDITGGKRRSSSYYDYGDRPTRN